MAEEIKRGQANNTYGHSRKRRPNEPTAPYCRPVAVPTEAEYLWLSGKRWLDGLRGLRIPATWCHRG
jgi:hypothetical protein